MADVTSILLFNQKEKRQGKILPRIFINLCLYYSITSSRITVMLMLMTIAMEFRALDSHTSPSISPVKPGTAEQMGLNARITSA